MMKKLIYLLIGLMSMTAVSLAQNNHPIEVKVGDFTQLRVDNSINVVYVADDTKAGTVEILGPQSATRMFIFKNNQKGRLVVQLSDYKYNAEAPSLVVYSKMLQEVVNQGDSTVTIKKNRDMLSFIASNYNNGVINVNGLNTTTTSLKVLTGHGRINVNGVTENLECSLAGTGQIHALELKAKEISCSMGGSGHVYCNSTGGKLHVKGVGSGKVHYIGTPSEVKVKKLGTVKAIPFDGTYAP